MFEIKNFTTNLILLLLGACLIFVFLVRIKSDHIKFLQSHTSAELNEFIRKDTVLPTLIDSFKQVGVNSIKCSSVLVNELGGHKSNSLNCSTNKDSFGNYIVFEIYGGNDVVKVTRDHPIFMNESMTWLTINLQPAKDKLELPFKPDKEFVQDAGWTIINGDGKKTNMLSIKELKPLLSAAFSVINKDNVLSDYVQRATASDHAIDSYGLHNTK
ncbi:hypothetical protein [Photobacterium damselae]|uniref:hypothetical protein n=1 Tax=Photobacterium damselae TaxID=38293 RepID=UPI001F3A0AB6|nr:hypothetical protein [Photobacterium damselae]UKA04544.1 hypothetical protein IHC89_23260 [Photobacterium damselae subsp. damselae]